MSLLTFLLEAVFISLSGVMAPGPITAVTLGKGSSSPHVGAFVAIGHGIIEFPLMISIFYGFGYFLKLSYIKAGIAFVGGLFLLFMGIGMFRSMTQPEITSSKYSHSPIMAGVLLTIGNPYFLIWWATIGAALIFNSFKFGVLGFIIFMFVHWLCDLVWFYFLSALSFKGGKFFGKGFQKISFGICGVFLLFFSGKFIFDAVKMIFMQGIS
ncbi:MAG: LysE family transporter [Thermodesulfobacteriota bacterium]|nr:LysE family transporter [Thermodesulfobacteriota bacterium]